MTLNFKMNISTFTMKTRKDDKQKMFTTKFEDNDLKVVIDGQVQKDLVLKGINPIEVFRLIESFAGKLLASQQDEIIQITNEDTGASLALDVKWQAEKQATVSVTIVNLDNLKIDEKLKSKVDLGTFPEEKAA